jgi:type IV pilus assembly protein PilA
MISMLHKMRERENGFTLVELLVVIVILGILIAIAVPTFLNQQNKAKSAKVESYLNTAYQVAKSESTSHNGNYTDASSTPAETPTTLAAAIASSEPELGTVPAVTADTAAVLGVKLSSANPVGVLNTSATSGSNLELVGLGDDGNYYKLVVTGNGVPKIYSSPDGAVWTQVN